MCLPTTPRAQDTEDGILLHLSRLGARGGAPEYEAGGGPGGPAGLTSLVKAGLFSQCLGEATLALCPGSQE